MVHGERSTNRFARGTWHIARSTLPMWRERAGTISYCPLPDGSVGDVVTSRKGGRVSHIVGIDRPIEAEGWQWQWCGVQPLTLLVRSRWRFIAGDADAGWAVTLFERTIFSAAGFDIYSRAPIIHADALMAAMQACADHSLAARHLPALFEPPHW